MTLRSRSLKTLSLLWLSSLGCLALAVPIQGSQAAPSQLTPAQLQHLSRDLGQPNGSDFFNRGQQQFEQEIQWLSRRQRLYAPDRLLQVKPDVQMGNRWPEEMNSVPLNPTLQPEER